MLAVMVPVWARVASAVVVAVAVVWALGGQALLRNRRKLDALWFARALQLIACSLALVGFFSPVFGAPQSLFYGYDTFRQYYIVGLLTLGITFGVMVLAFFARPTPTGLLLTLFQALLAVLGGVLWVRFLVEQLELLRFGSYLLESGFIAMSLAALWQLKLVGDRMPNPPPPVGGRPAA